MPTPHGLINASGTAVGWLYHDAPDGTIEKHNGKPFKYSSADGAWHEVTNTPQVAPATRTTGRSNSMTTQQVRPTEKQWVRGTATTPGHWVNAPAGGAARRPVAPMTRPVVRPGTSVTPAQGWYQGSDGHAYNSSTNKDLGLIVPGSQWQVVQPTNGGKLWALGNLQSNGTVTGWQNYGSVPGVPPPPNAVAPEQFAAAPPPPAPVYAAPSSYYAQPTYAAPVPTYAAPAPAPVYAAQPMYAPQPVALPAPVAQVAAPMVDPTTGVSLAGAPYGIDPVTGQALTYSQAQWYAQYGANTVASQISQGQQAAQAAAQQPLAGLDPLTASILSGGGYMDTSGLSGLAGGLDPTTLALLSGGDDDLALQMALSNGGYDPTGGMAAMMNPVP